MENVVKVIAAAVLAFAIVGGLGLLLGGFSAIPTILGFVIFFGAIGNALGLELNL